MSERQPRGIQGGGVSARPVRCPDDGACHHNCGSGYCFRVEYCEPLTAAGWGDRWPESIRRVYGSDDERTREADPYTDPEWLIWVKGIWRKFRHWLVPLVLVGLACGGGLAALVVLLAGGPHPRPVTLAPSPAKFCGRAGVRVWFFDGQNESVACFDGRAFQWSR